VIWRIEGNALRREVDNRRIMRELMNRQTMPVTPLQRREVMPAALRGAEELEELEVRA
jgi:hypothetical protein